MTAVLPDLDTIEHLDFDDQPLCSINEHRDQAVTAIALVRWTLPCCTGTDLVCAEHKRWMEEVRSRHAPAECEIHHGVTCSCEAMTLELLP